MALEQMNGCGPLLLELKLHGVDGSIKKVKLANLLSYIHGACKAGGGFHTLLKKTLAKHHGPLSPLVYADEVTLKMSWAMFQSGRCGAYTYL